MQENQWRFPASGHGERKGISSGDTEAFKKSPFQAFAREVLQNSIDARATDEEPTKVEFSIFEMNTSDIPGCPDLKNAIRRCKEFWAHKPDYVKECDDMLEVFNKGTIRCLRVSDYNTTGLIGVDSKDQANNKFLALTKGTGVSEKTGSMAGGSKGVGKNAVFLMSALRTVFYSTIANQDINGCAGQYSGSIGVAELVSGYIDDVIIEDRDYTQGTGYFARDNVNSAMTDLLKLGTHQEERNGKPGTDIYILGFIPGDGWEKEVINSILDSFMSTIVRGELIVRFNGLEISKETVGSIVYDDSIIFKNQKANIVSQYRLLTDGDNVKLFDIDTDYGSCQLMILPYKKEEDELATHKCAMIRHPLMKIKDEPLGSSFRVSAMCIIGEGTLGKALRDIENPQHVDWEPKRIKDKSVRKEIENVIKEIKEQIKQRVIECLQLGDDNPLDPNGAGDFLPDVEVGDSKADSNGNQLPAEAVSVSKPKDNLTFEKNTRDKSDDGTGLEPDIGEVDDSKEGNVQHPVGENDEQGGGRHPGSEESGEKEGDNVIFKRSKLAGVRYRVISLNKTEGKIRILFMAPIDYENCYLSISILDDVNNSTPIAINSLICNGANIQCDDSKEFGPFAIKTNQKIQLDATVEATGYFGSEVKVICK
ncbi:MAG TPA: hypothetical protein PKC96_01515 [Bacilli bacterium]|nr:hypothetical protein [Bacilli bacterium]